MEHWFTTNIINKNLLVQSPSGAFTPAPGITRFHVWEIHPPIHPLSTQSSLLYIIVVSLSQLRVITPAKVPQLWVIALAMERTTTPYYKLFWVREWPRCTHLFNFVIDPLSPLVTLLHADYFWLYVQFPFTQALFLYLLCVNIATSTRHHFHRTPLCNTKEFIIHI